MLSLIAWGSCLLSLLITAANLLLAGRVTWPRAAYRRGWVEGRQAMTYAMVEAMNRRLSLTEFIEAEAARDGYAVRFRVEGEE